MEAAANRVTVDSTITQLLDKLAVPSHREALAANAAKPRRFDRLVGVIHFHKGGGTSFNQLMIDSGLLGLTHSSELRLHTFNIDNDYIVRQSDILNDPSLYQKLYERGVDFVAFENSFVGPAALNAVLPQLRIITSVREPWTRWKSSYEREVSSGCRQLLRYQGLVQSFHGKKFQEFLESKPDREDKAKRMYRLHAGNGPLCVRGAHVTLLTDY